MCKDNKKNLDILQIIIDKLIIIPLKKVLKIDIKNNMQIYTHKTEIDNYILQTKKKGLKIGVVPTMGALHQGHLSLVKKALEQTDIVIVSIFVNPKQFNNSTDLEKYPRTHESDIELLESNGCHALFMPSTDEMYAGTNDRVYDLGYLDTILEATFRKGHFNGVAFIVDLLFELIQPNKAFFGEKDYQQLAIIKQLVKQKHPSIEIVSCPIIREIDGLAMSSRNMRLTPANREQASFIYNTLNEIKLLIKSHDLDYIKTWVNDQFKLNPAFQLEYFELIDTNTFYPVTTYKEASSIIGLIAVYLGEIRLIDNMLFKP